MKNSIISYLNSNKHHWWTVGLLPGLYAISYLYHHNYTLVNSWTQFAYLVLQMIVAPSLIVLLVNHLIKKQSDRVKNAFNASAVTILTAITVSLVIYLGWRWKGLLLISVITVVASWFVGKHYKKGVLILGLMTVLSILQFAFYFFTDVLQKQNWVTTSPLTTITFQKKPNIYYIQPDGYSAKPALENIHYDYNNDRFYSDLEQRDFYINHEYRTNYPSTLSSNAALFTGQHHFYDQGTLKNELFNAREIIMGNNPVLQTFKNNGYQTTAILQHRYLLLNHPEVAYDRINISSNELSSLPKYKLDKNYLSDLKSMMQSASDAPQFYFVEILEPGHIPGLPYKGSSPIKQREDYISKLNHTSTKLLQMIDHITQQDPNSIIIIAADHGGFVGFNYATQCYEKPINDATLKSSIFRALLAVKAPSEFESCKDHLKSSVSLFPTLFYYLGNKSMKEQNMDNSSYQLIKSGSQGGVYRYYDDHGTSVTEKIL